MTSPEHDLADLNDAITTLVPSDATATGSTYGRTDWDNGRRVALYEASNLRYVNDVDEWFTWCGNRWVVASRGDQVGVAARTALRIADEAAHVDDDEERGRHVQWAQSSLSETHLRAMISLATGVSEIRTPIGTFDAATQFINAPNCTFNPSTLEWHPHRREDMLTQLCPTSFVPDATSQRLDDFLERFLPDEKERAYTLQVLAVSSLANGNDAHRIIILLGPPATGKSTLMDLVKRTLGTDYVASVNPSVFRGNLDDKPRPDLLRALKSRLILAFEASERWDLHSDQIKRMTGGDPITARAMRSDYMNETIASYVPIIVANTVPQISGVDDALRRRLLALLMDTPVADDADDGRLRHELVNDEYARQALLARLVQSYHDCGGIVKLPMPPRFAELTMEMFAGFDNIDEIMHSLRADGSLYPASDIGGAHVCARTSEVFRCYREWLRRNGTPQMMRDQLGPKQFAKRLKSLGYEIHRSDGSRLVGWCLGDTSTTNIARF